LDLGGVSEADVNQVRKLGEHGRAVVATVSSRDQQPLQEMLEPRHDVRIASSVNELVSLVKSGAVDAVFIDAEESLDPLLSLQADPTLEPIAIFVLADPGTEVTAVQSLEMGAHDYILRPLRPVEVLARLERGLKFLRERVRLRALADTDALTGLANFRALTNRLDQEIRRSLRYGYSLAVVMVDLDHLKQLNDGFGHEEGNRAIVALSDHLRRNLRDADFAARFGGDEFIAILPYQTEQEAAVFAERVRQGVASIRLALAGDQLATFQLSISVGIAATHVLDESPTAESLLARADSALYEAKRAGRNRIVVSPVPKHDVEPALAHHA
jgi:two-component system cell cycle response regulator